MTDAQTPRRWFESTDAPPEWNDCVRADEASGPTPLALERVLHGVANQLGRPELSGGASQPPTAAGPSIEAPSSAPAPYLEAVFKLRIGLTLLAIAAGTVFILRDERATLPTPAPRPVPAPIAAPAVQMNVPRDLPPSAAPVPVAAPPSERASPRPAIAAPREPARVSGAESGDAAAELPILERAQRALRTDPSHTLELTNEHRRKFPNGAFAQEREMLAIEALIYLDRRPDAERRARAFRRLYASSSHQSRLDDLLNTTAP